MKYYSAIILILLVTVSAKAATDKPQYHHPLAFIAKIQSDPNKGEKIYKAMCANCHATQPLIKVGAPKFRNIQDWQPRQKKGMQKLILSLQENLGIMPARGGCFECSDNDPIGCHSIHAASSSRSNDSA